MELIQLKYFHLLAELQNMTQAANLLHIAQPALSRSLRKLEQELGLQLFDRVGKYLYLNENGRILHRYTDVILREVENAQRELDEQKGMVGQRVSLSMLVGGKLLPEIVSEFKHRYPDIALKIIQQGNQDESTERCDITVFSSMTMQEDEHTVTLMEEEIYLAMPVDNPLSKRKEIDLAEVVHEPFICLQKGMELRSLTDEYCQMAGFQPHIILESDNPGTVRKMIALGVGLSFVPFISWQGYEPDPNVKLVKIRQPQCRRYINMTWRNGSYTPRASVLMRNFLVDFFSQAVEQAKRKN